MRALAGLVSIATLCTACVVTPQESASSRPPSSAMRAAPAPTALSLVSQSIAAGDLGRARQILENARSEGGSESELSLARAMIALAEERLGIAEEQLDIAAAATPDLATVDLLRGRMAEMRGAWGEAREAYATAGRKDPTSSAAIILESRVLLVMGQPAESAKLLARAVQSAPGAAELQRAAGEAYLAADAPQKSLPYLRSACTLDPSDIGALESLAIALHRVGKHAEVVALLDGRDSAALPDHVQLLVARSALLAGRGDVAAGLLEKCTRAFDQDPEVWLDLARAKVLSNRPAQARTAVEHALALQPNSAKAFLLAGHIHKLAGRPREAGLCYAQALREGADPVLVAPLIEALVPAASDPHSVPRSTTRSTTGSTTGAAPAEEECQDEGPPIAPAPGGRAP